MKFWKTGKTDNFEGQPDKLRDALLEAIAQGNQSEFVRLCQNNQRIIFDHFQSWQKVPEAMRANPERVQWYSQGIIAVASYFAQNGKPALLQRLAGPPDTNPITRWNEAFGQAQGLLGDKRPDEAVRVLEDLLVDLRRSQGSAVDDYTPKTLGLLGIAYFHCARFDKAIEVTEQAYLACKKLGDVEGIAAYCGNLEEISRQSGNAAEAERWRKEKENILALAPHTPQEPKQDDASELIFRDVNGRELRRGDLQGYTGQVRWEILGKDNVPHQAEKLHQAGRNAGQRGDYDEALRQLSQAAELAPMWPYPVYDAAFTYLLKSDFDNALACYQKVDELAPRGFFTSKTALHTLHQEKTGHLPQGIYALYMTLEWEASPEKKRQIVEQLLERCPAFAPAWKEKANLQQDSSERLGLIDRGLQCNPDPETRGVLLIDKALVLAHQGQKQKAVEILSELALDPDETLQNEHLAKAVLASLI